MTIAEKLSISPGVSTQTMRSVLGAFATGVVVVTTYGEAGEPVGITANSFSSVSLDPPLVSWCLRVNSYSLAAFRHSRRFAINVLGAGGTDLCRRFASANEHKWRDIQHYKGEHECPLLAESIATLECSLVAEYEAGDHLIFIGRVEKAETDHSAFPLVVYRGGFYDLSREHLKMHQARLG
jgi:flavin reductase (DIM6/NTAB) family NADH-FMN oxidoreductase RutF